jgi:glycerophosphoryl diester phosphodiesterase
MVVGHRGAAGLAIENSMAAFQQALTLGVDAVEMDIRLTSDGQIILWHDDSLSRLGDDRQISDLTAAQCRALQLEDGQPIPMLEDVLEALAGRVALCIELKQPDMTRQLALLLSRFADRLATKECQIISFFHHALVEVKQQLPWVKIGPILAGVPEGLAAFATDIGADLAHLCIHFLTPELVDDAHRRGIRVFGWTANEPSHIIRALALGLDGITSDYPDRVLRRLEP